MDWFLFERCPEDITPLAADLGPEGRGAAGPRRPHRLPDRESLRSGTAGEDVAGIGSDCAA